MGKFIQYIESPKIWLVIIIFFFGMYVISSNSSSTTLEEINTGIKNMGVSQQTINEHLRGIDVNIKKLVEKDSILEEQLLKYPNSVIVIQGVRGQQGIQGPAGTKGKEGKEGDKGVQGEQGVQGDEGKQGIPHDSINLK